MLIFNHGSELPAAQAADTNTDVAWQSVLAIEYVVNSFSSLASYRTKTVTGTQVECSQGPASLQMLAPLWVALEQDLQERPGLRLAARRRRRLRLAEGDHGLTLAATHGRLERLALLDQRILRHHLRSSIVTIT